MENARYVGAGLNWARDPSSPSYSNRYEVITHGVPGPVLGAEQNRRPPRAERLEICMNEYLIAKCPTGTHRMLDREGPPGAEVARKGLSEEGTFRLKPDT